MRVLAGFGALGIAGALVASSLTGVGASSHREAPLITEDPVADTTDVYAFVSPDDASKVTIVANWIPLEEPAGGPNFGKFGDDVLYELNIDNNGDAADDVVYEFRFKTTIKNDSTFLYNTGPITFDDKGTLGKADDEYVNWNQVQTYTVTEVRNGVRTVLGSNLLSPPVNIGPRSTPNYATLASKAVHSLPGGIKVFAGQRDDPFFVDLGSVFDLLGLRPLNGAHALPQPTAPGVDDVAGYNTHSIAIQVPKSRIAGADGIIGVYSETYRRKVRVFEGNDGTRLTHSGPWVQVSRLGMPLVNEVVIPLRDKDKFNASSPVNDAQFGPYVLDPEPARLIPGLYPVFTCFPTAPRTDLATIFLTGIPGVNMPANVRPSEMIRLNTNMASGFPNGRTLTDDVVDTELVALAGGLPGQACAGMSPNNALTDGVNANDTALLSTFPYVGTPHAGYDSHT